MSALEKSNQVAALYAAWASEHQVDPEQDPSFQRALAGAADMLEWRTVDDGILCPDEGDRARILPAGDAGTVDEVDNLSIHLTRDDGSTAAVPVDQVEPLEAAMRRATEVLEGKAGGKLFGMGNATYDVEKMHTAAEGKPTVAVDPRQFAHAFGEVRIEPTYAMKTNLSKPVLLAAAPNGAVRLVDGWHRAYKAAHLGKPLKGRVIGEHELENCRVTEASSEVDAGTDPF